MKSFDIVINGGGMVGLTAALAIRKLTELSVAVIDKSEPSALSEQPELRVSAISAASKQILVNLGVWSELGEQRLQPYTHMHVWDKHGYGQLNFDADLLNDDYANLGWIIENNVIRTSLWHQAEQDAGITIINEPVAQLAQGESDVFLSFEMHVPVTAKLLIAADGANSWVRNQLDIAMTFRDYEHHALVATVDCGLGHQNTAWQVFLESGPLAFLPLYQSNLCSIVWSLPPDEAQQLLQLDAAEFSKKISAASDGKLGQVTLASNIESYPLTMRLAREFVNDRVILIGDAAHTIHPLAGQGVNLGLLDAVALAQSLAQVDDLNSISTHRALAKFARWRKSEATDMIAAMEAIKQLFTPQQALPKVVRGLGMSLIDKVSPVKTQLIKQAMGLRSDLPDLATNRVTAG